MTESQFFQKWVLELANAEGEMEEFRRDIALLVRSSQPAPVREVYYRDDHEPGTRLGEPGFPGNFQGM